MLVKILEICQICALFELRYCDMETYDPAHQKVLVLPNSFFDLIFCHHLIYFAHVSPHVSISKQCARVLFLVTKISAYIGISTILYTIYTLYYTLTYTFMIIYTKYASK